MRQRARPVGPAPDAGRLGAGHVDVELGARLRGHAHPLGPAQHFDRRADPLLQRGVRHHALQRFGMLVGDIENARAGFENLRRLRRVHQPFDGAVDHKARLLQRADHRPELLDRDAGAGGADRNHLAVARRRHHDVKGFGAHPQQREFGEVNVERARLGLRQNRRGVAGLDRAALENLAERIDPFCFYAIREHVLSPLQSSCPGLSRASTSFSIQQEDVDGRVKPSHDRNCIRLPESRATDRTASPATGR